MPANNFDGMLELISADKIELSKLRKQYRAAALTHHPDKGGNQENFGILNRHYILLSPFIDGKSLSEEDITAIKEALLNSSYKVRKGILAEIKTVDIDTFNKLKSVIEINVNAEWTSLNTKVLDGDIFSKAPFESLGKISYAKFSQFFTPFESKGQFGQAVSDLALNSLKLSVYLLLSASAIDYLIISAACISFHEPVYVNSNELKSDSNSISFTLKAFAYSIFLDAISTLLNPFINLLTLVLRSAATIVSWMAQDNIAENSVSAAVAA